MKTKSLFLMLLVVGMMSCNKNDDVEYPDFRMSEALSIFVNNGKVGISSLVNQNNNIYTEYWIDSTKVDTTQFKAFMPLGSSYRTSIDKHYYASTVCKKSDGSFVEYKFPRLYNFDPHNQLYYYKNNVYQNMDTLMLGAIHSVDISNGEIFAGFFGAKYFNESGAYFLPIKAFYWMGTGKPVELPMPSQYSYFNGVSCICKSGTDVYVGGLFDYPMYWKNKEVVRLNDKYGEVNQIKSIGYDIYAVGFYNKSNSNSTGNTACYWKNGQLVELEDNAVAFSIFVDGSDIYVAGAVGRFDTEYKACYWKNGKRILLPETARN